MQTNNNNQNNHPIKPSFITLSSSFQVLNPQNLTDFFNLTSFKDDTIKHSDEIFKLFSFYAPQTYIQIKNNAFLDFSNKDFFLHNPNNNDFSFSVFYFFAIRNYYNDALNDICSIMNFKDFLLFNNFELFKQIAKNYKHKGFRYTNVYQDRMLLQPIDKIFSTNDKNTFKEMIKRYAIHLKNQTSLFLKNLKDTINLLSSYFNPSLKTQNIDFLDFKEKSTLPHISAFENANYETNKNLLNRINKELENIQDDLKSDFIINAVSNALLEVLDENECDIHTLCNSIFKILNTLNTSLFGFFADLINNHLLSYIYPFVFTSLAKNHLNDVLDKNLLKIKNIFKQKYPYNQLHDILKVFYALIDETTDHYFNDAKLLKNNELVKLERDLNNSDFKDLDLLDKGIYTLWRFFDDFLKPFFADDKKFLNKTIINDDYYNYEFYQVQPKLADVFISKFIFLRKMYNKKIILSAFYNDVVSNNASIKNKTPNQ